MRHLTTVKNLNQNDIESIFTIADKLDTTKYHSALKDKTIALLFFENSTRTLVSFELAAKKLGANVINVNIAKSSTQKGESLKDTLLTLQAMGVNCFVIRHSKNFICEKIKTWLNPHVSIINAGDGNNQHPSQTLLDYYTIRKHFHPFHNIKISIVGDIKHSRVASSFIQLAKNLKLQPITIFGPPELVIAKNSMINKASTFEQAITNHHVIMLLRVQKERINNSESVDFETYNSKYGFKKQHLKTINSNTIIMHPGPFNRNIEIDSEVVDHHQSVIFDQVANGVLIRQAILLKLLS